MNKKERMDLFLGKIPENEKKKTFLEELRSCQSKKETHDLLDKYGVELSEEDITKLHEGVRKELSLEDLKNVSGGSCASPYTGCVCSCAAGACNCGNDCDCCFDSCGDFYY